MIRIAQGVVLLAFGLLCCLGGCKADRAAGKREPAPAAEAAALPAWAVGPFTKLDSVNPVLSPRRHTRFRCPLRNEEVAWEAKDVFNPACVVRRDTLWLLYRAEDLVGRHHGTSRIGLAWSTDGLHFERLPEPVLYPDEDHMKVYEWEGGIEDPRLIELPDGRYLMTYTAYDGRTARLCVATSTDLRRWRKHGLAFGESRWRDLWSKSGAVVGQRQGSRIVAHRIDGRFWMYWGDTHIFAATSPDGIRWEPVVDEQGRLVAVLSPRKGRFDSQLVEPGPPALWTPRGIVLLYNSRNLDEGGAPDLPPGTYTAAQVLLHEGNPVQVRARMDRFFLAPEAEYERQGQVGNVVFVEGWAPFRGRWWLYYGTADSHIALAVAPGSFH